MSNTSHVTSVAELDLNRYLGQWFEIGRLPLKWEDTGASRITATYSLDEDASIRVDNRCFDEDGKPSQSIGRATTTDVPSQLEVTFLPAGLRWLPFTKGDYWVLKLDEHYQVALVGTPNHENLWLLARDPQLSQATLQEYLDEAKRQGFDLSAWITPHQDGVVVTDDLLAD